MSHTPQTHRLLRPETLTAAGLLVLSAAFLVPTAAMRPMSALLPATMLLTLIVLAVILLIMDQRSAAQGIPATPVMAAPRRVATAFGLIIAYFIGVDLVGFYPATAVSVPLVAYMFGYRHLPGLVAATVIVLALIWGIFSVAMSQEFPAGLIWQMEAGDVR